MERLEQTDPVIADLIRRERTRQRETLELIASENHVSIPVLRALGSVLTDKYAEGYPHKRCYCGCGEVDDVEQVAIDRAKKLFGAEHANVQPHSGTSANLAVYLASIQPGDKILGMDLSHGGHLSHGKNVNLSGTIYNPVYYGVREDTEMLDMDDVRRVAKKEQPAMIIAGASAYPRKIDFAAFGEIAKEVGALLLSDIAHIAGLVATGDHPDPVPYSDFVTTTNHKTLRGPRGGIILCREKYAKAVDRAVFPGMQGGPLMHSIAAKAVAFHEAMQPEFKAYTKAILANAKALAARLMEKGWRLVSGGTDNHLLLIDLRSRLPEMTGKQAATLLDSVGIVCNMNAIPFDPRSVMTTSGIRLGTPAVTTRGLDENDMAALADWIDQVLMTGGKDTKILTGARGYVAETCKSHPVPNHNL
jgi:glycine hydroxymethyltransferase